MGQLHVAVVGAGIVGLASAYHVFRSGARVTVIDRDPEGDKASYGNAGAIAVTEVVPPSVPGVAWRVPGWMLDPLGPLSIRPAHVPRLIPWLTSFARVGTHTEMERISKALAALNSRVYEDLIPMLQVIGLDAELHRNGALTLYESEEGYQRDAPEWACKRARNIEVHELTPKEAWRMEPALGDRLRRAVFMPQWSHVSDPRKIVESLRRWLLEQGVAIRKGEVHEIAAGSRLGVLVNLLDDERIRADRVIVAAGAWSGILARRLGDRVLLESERGYNATLPQPGIEVRRQLIFAERKFVATPLRCGLRIGGAAEFGGLRAKANFDRSRKLIELARRYLPGLRIEGSTHWAGHRPATPDSLPVIGYSPRLPDVLYAFGHGHLGLTQAATTGRLVCDLIWRKSPPVDMGAFGIERFARTKDRGPGTLT